MAQACAISVTRLGFPLCADNVSIRVQGKERMAVPMAEKCDDDQSIRDVRQVVLQGRRIICLGQKHDCNTGADVLIERHLRHRINFNHMYKCRRAPCQSRSRQASAILKILTVRFGIDQSYMIKKATLPDEKTRNLGKGLH